MMKMFLTMMLMVIKMIICIVMKVVPPVSLIIILLLFLGHTLLCLGLSVCFEAWLMGLGTINDAGN